MAAPSCRRTRSTWPLVYIAAAAMSMSIASAIPLHSGEQLSESDVQYYTTSPDYTFVKPLRLGTRHRKSLDVSDITSTIEFTIGGFENTFRIELLESMNLFDAGLLIKRIGADGQTRIEQPSRACYHQGRLVGQEDSTSVSLSACDDELVGLIRTPDADYALKPLTKEHADLLASSSDEESEAPSHILYKVPADDVTLPLSDTAGVRPKANDIEQLKKREIDGTTKTVETSVVADSTLFEKHGGDTEFYLFTILNQVAGLFRDKSLTPNIQLKVNSITILEEPQSNLDLTDELSHSLTNFCKWQKDQNSDISVLLTRRDLQIGGNHDVTGKAVDVGGACDPSRRCVIAEDHGPSGAIFTLAHEMGHSLGMYHDDAESGCDNNRNIMASGNSGGSEAFQWSRCSNSDLNDFLGMPESECLDRTADEFPAFKDESIIMPGYFYDADKQCQMTFGPGATVADDYLNSLTMCAELKCQVAGSGEPVTNHVPVLDGTKCGSKRQICIHGECLRVASMYDCEATGGPCVPEWLPGSYGDCQADCFRYRNVFCVERHDDLTTVIVTDLSRCPVERPVEREYCCDTPGVGEAQYVVVDGTCSVSCGTGVEVRTVTCRDTITNEVVDEAICTDPRPEEVVECALQPCASVSYVLFYNNWGECSVTCDQGIQTRTAFCSDSAGNSQALSICEAEFGSLVTTRVCTRTSCSGPVVDTYFYIAGAYGSCSVSCGQGTQTRSVTCEDINGNQVDMINCANLARPPSLQICNLASCPETYTYVATDFGNCSASCGPGIQTRQVFCLDGDSQVVSEALCLERGLTRPVTSQVCQTQPCVVTYAYSASDFPPCTATCGTQVLTRTVTCVSSEAQIVDNSLCAAAGLVAPATSFTCELDPCGNYDFVTGDLSACSATCGVGIQTRSVACVDLDNNNNVVSNNLCAGEAPATAVLCNVGDCPSEYTFLTSSFSECNCEGIQTRIVVCVTYSNGAPVPATELDCLNAGLTVPMTTRSCPVPPSCIPIWQVGDWSTCSVSCGSGIQVRDVFCVESEGSSTLVNPALCDQQAQPSNVQICELSSCAVYSFVAESFGDCSVTCGEGVRRRNVSCYRITGVIFEVVDSSLCNPAEEPPSQELCSLEACGGVYQAYDWTTCSVTCGLGIQTREVACVSYKGSGVELSESECRNMTRPSEQRECYLDPCPPPYGCDQEYLVEEILVYPLRSPGYPNNYPSDLNCSKILLAPNNSHIQITITDFLLEDGCAYDRLMLIDLASNTTTRLCDTEDLPYVYESFGPEVEVRFITDGTVTERGFSASYQLVPERAPDYFIGEWGECSVTCGEGEETREVTCQQNGIEVDDSLCAGLPVPPATRPCLQPVCPPADACDENILRLEPGTISSPNFPEQYPSNITCINTLRAPEGQVVTVTIVFVGLDGNIPCSDSDVLVLQDGSQPVNLCGSVASGTSFTSLTNVLRVTFISDDQLSSSNGFLLNYDFTYPTFEICGAFVTLSGQPIYSPNYPDNYGNNNLCITTIYNEDGCIEIDFLSMNINNGNNGNGCEDDVLLIQDSSSQSPVAYCDNEVPEQWISASGTVRVTFVSNQFNTSRGYIAIPRFVECPSAIWVPLPYGNCSASCGEGNRTRGIECRSALTSELVDPSQCPEERPVTFAPCSAGPCPSCNAVETVGNRVSRFPFAQDFYEYNDECTLTITNENGCIRLFIFALDINESPEQQCGRDSLRLFDPANIFANEPFCGSIPPTMRYQTLGSTVQVTLRAEDSQRYKNVEVYPSFGTCPTHAFRPLPWGPCSVSCGGGTRTRIVPCVNLETGQGADASLCADSNTYDTEGECNTQECPACVREVVRPGIVMSPGFGSDEGYDNDLDCFYNITSPDNEECVTITFPSFDLGDPEESQTRCGDYVQIVDEEGDQQARYCALAENATVPVFYGRSSNVYIIFRTDEEDRNNGFEAFITFETCPEFGFVASNFSECSATCGGGLRTREVNCVRFSTGLEVADEICQDTRPAETVPCSAEPCPSCDQVLTEQGIFNSPNFPNEYDNDQECVYTLLAAERCVRVTFLSTFELGEGVEDDCEDEDHIDIEDEYWEYIDAQYCGTERPPVWRSRSNTTTVTFHSNDEDTYRGFTGFFSLVDCPRFGFTVGEFGECDETCGEGVRQREVVCRDLVTQEEADDFLCTDPRPDDTEECSNDPCPNCDETITEDSSYLIRSSYEVSLECVYNITAPSGMCVRIFALAYDLTPPDEDGQCEGDFLTVRDYYYPYREDTVCGSSEGTPQEVISYDSTGLVIFRSDDVDQPGSFTLFFSFTECPEFGYLAGEFGECSATCDGGVRYREVNCTRLATGEVVSEDNCNPLEKVSESEECNEESCPDCYREFSERNGFIRESAYGVNQDCVYNITAPDDLCLLVVGIDWDLTPPEDGECRGDYITIADAQYPYLEDTLCGRKEEVFSVQSYGSQSIVRFVSDDEDQPGFFHFSYTVINCPQYGYAVSEFGECSVSCGSGERYRNVTCTRLATGEEVSEDNCDEMEGPNESEECNEEPCPICFQYISTSGEYIYSPNYPAPYDNNQQCITYIEASPDKCINLFILNLEMQDPLYFDSCLSSDYLLINDIFLPGEDVPVNQVLCGEVRNFQWTSSFSNASLYFFSDADITSGGFQIYSSFVDCQRYFYYYELFNECSVTCGPGSRTREVYCVDRFNNMNRVSDSLCAGTPRPVDTILCYPGDCLYCDAYVFESEVVESPNYPEDIPPEQICNYGLINVEPNGCWNITLLEYEGDGGDECESGFNINDLLFNTSEIICEEAESYLSISSSLSVTYFNANNNGSAFRIQYEQIQCPVFAYVPGPFGECSVSCGEGVMTREVRCLLLQGSLEVSDDNCEGEKPDEEEPCELRDCPSCDRIISMTGAVNLMSPNYPSNYDNNQECIIELSSQLSNQDCISFSVAFLDLEPSQNDTGCWESDRLEFYSQITPGQASPELAHVYCGEHDNFEWVAIGTSTRLKFSTNSENTYQGYFIVASPMDCPLFHYAASNFSECSVTCGRGVQSRDVFCAALGSFIEVPDSFCASDIRPVESIPCYERECTDCYQSINTTTNVTSPNYPGDYFRDQNCTYELYNPRQCWELSFTDMDIKNGTGEAKCADGLLIRDLKYDTVDDVLLCGDQPPDQPYRSFSKNLRVTFFSDGEEEGRGFSGVFTTVECPTHGYLPSRYSWCSVTCGEGVQSRSVNCVRLATRNVEAGVVCPGDVPPTERPCNMGTCPMCDESFYEPQASIFSPNYPANYDNNQQCDLYLNVSAADGRCLNITIVSMDLEEPDPYLGCFYSDRLIMYERNSSFTDHVFCGTQQGVSHITTSPTRISFISNDVDTYSGYEITYDVVTCPWFFRYSVGPFSECSVSCGYGMQRRSVNCMYGSTVLSRGYCDAFGLLQPIETKPCKLEDCPSCDATISSTNMNTRSSSPYPLFQECKYEFTNREGGCISFVFQFVDLPPTSNDSEEEEECERDFLVYKEEGQYGREFSICGNSFPSFISRSSSATLIFYSDGYHDEKMGNLYNGFSVFSGFVVCPAYGFIADEEFGECDVVCGGGVRSRTVTCIDLSNGNPVDDSMCTDFRPSDSLPCNTDPCPVCDVYINETGIMFGHFNETEDYEENLNCLFTIDIPEGCFKLRFSQFQLAGDECHDYVEIRDLAPFSEHLTKTVCTELQAGIDWQSRSSRAEVRFVSDDEDGNQGFQISVTPTVCPDYGYVHSNYSECSVTCGEGVQTRDVKCVELANGIPGNLSINPTLCPDEEPSTMVECELEECPSCDRNFTLSTPVNFASSDPYPHLAECTDTITAPEGTCIILSFVFLDLESSEDCANDSLVVADPFNEQISFTFCDSVMSVPSPIYSSGNVLTLTLETNEVIEARGYQAIASQTTCPNVTWVIQDTAPCSTSCGDGVITRTVYCWEQNSNRRFEQEESCLGDRPAESIPCNLGDCPQECRLVKSNLNSRELTSPGYPNHLYENNLVCENFIINYAGCVAITIVAIDIEPAVDSQCQNDSLSIFDSRMPSVGIDLCGNTLPTYNLWVSTFITPVTVRLQTDGANRYPGYNLTFDFVPCPRQGFTVGQFGECSVTCGTGIITRNISCEDTNGNTLPDVSCWGQRPLSEEPCFMEPCNYSFDVSNWSTCSASCGGDVVQTRTVQCLADNTTVVNASFCLQSGLQMPDREISCGLPDCPMYQYSVSEWSQCSALCDNGTETRSVTCVDQFNNTVNDTLCSQSARPSDTQNCSANPCSVYSITYTAPTSCSTSCGPGIQSQYPICRESGQVVSVAYCRAANLDTAIVHRPCNNGDCIIINPTCGDTIDERSMAGNINSPGYPSAAPDGLNCLITFEIPANYLLSIRITEYQLDSSCSEELVISGDVSPAYTVCATNAAVPINLSFLLDSNVSVNFSTDSNSGNSPLFAGTYEYIVQP